MQPSPINPATRRNSRRAVDIPCDVISNHSDDAAVLWATDLSSDGMWLEASRPLPLGDELVVCFRPGIGWRSREVHVFARVARMSRGQRANDDGCGMGVEFLDLTEAQRRALRGWLWPRPDKPPRRREVDGQRRAVALAAHPFFAQLTPRGRA